MKLHDESARTFASDNYAGVLPEVLAAIGEANGGHQVAYGGDVYTARLTEVMRAEFGEQAEVFPVFNGTGANVTA
ncbi:MAG: threonine aldolase, partial [Glaciihabitans sp.]|nr:threonine aldolase [Glaciihabitans sp.]